MRDLAGRLAVVTGGGSGMGRELVCQLASAGCHVATCDVSDDGLRDTRQTADRGSVPGSKVSTFRADVADEEQVRAFRDFVAAEHEVDYINLLFNNAGIGAGGSFVVDDRAEWDATFAVCWGGVYACLRVFLPMLLASEEAHVVNTSSANGFWASLGPEVPHTAYSAAKFAVKGLSEALITDFRINAPHVRVSVVMPGHIGTSIVTNTGRYFGFDPKDLSDEQVGEARARLERRGIDPSAWSDEDVRQAWQAMGELFQDAAPMTASEAAAVILDGVRNDQWRIVVGSDAKVLDEAVREAPEEAYEPSFIRRLTESGAFHGF